MSHSDRSRKLFIRSLLAGTTTLATLMGAQSLALIDSQPVLEDLEDAVSQNLTLMPTLATFPTNAVAEASPTATIHTQSTDHPEPTLFKAEPSITIFRQPGSTNNASTQANTGSQNTASIDIAANNTRTIQPPQPVELQPPDPIVVVEDPVVIVQPAPQPAPSQPQQQSSAKKSSSSKKSRSGSSR